MRYLKLLAIFAFFLSTTKTSAQHLKRLATIGIQPQAITENLPAPGGIEIVQVFPNSTASALQLQQGDILLHFNGQRVYDLPTLTAAKGDMREGNAVSAEVWRNGKTLLLKGKAVGKALETSTTSEVLYGEIPYQDGWLRTIVNKPTKPGKHPTIFFIPGYTCSTIDNLHGLHPYRKLLDSLSGLGYAIFRLEKPGVGDNPGDCQQLGFDQELEAYRKAYQHLKDYDFIDLENVIIFGHSMGGVYAPLIASQYQPKGVIVYGTVHESWAEYLLKMVRYQNPYFGQDYAAVDTDMHVLYELIYQHYYQNKSSKELYQNPRFQTLLQETFAFDGEDQILYRHEDFWREINAHNLSKAWKNSHGYVLSIYGEADIEAVNDASHKEIVRLRNHYYPGTATYRFLEGTNHSLIKVGSMEQGLALRGTPEYQQYMAEAFNYELVEMMDEWIQKIRTTPFPKNRPEPSRP